ncbi:class I SAM-dependent methyltransferase [Kitasatospora mediocidica]|uniref:class I SAM-dependent methyltransferase n=1 Tax=Kitasatospora mediocidica TaxID=58352 RepID=UPI00068C13B8|nr:methyltransferase domain-containing protein [Kitasatospora mediocidica]
MASAQGTATRSERADSSTRARDWAEIQERMLVPLYEAVYQRLEVGPAGSVLGIGCRSGLALLLAAARGAQVAGLESAPELRELARGRRLRVLADALREPADPDNPRTAYALVTVFEELHRVEDPQRLVAGAATAVLPGGHLVLAGWGPAERCESAAVLEVAHRRSAPVPDRDPFALSSPGALEQLLACAGLRPAGSGRVSCPFAYPDLDSAVRGVLSTGLFDAALEYSGEALVTKELVEALHPFGRTDGSVRMANVFRYVVAERPR